MSRNGWISLPVTVDIIFTNCKQTNKIQWNKQHLKKSPTLMEHLKSHQHLWNTWEVINTYGNVYSPTCLIQYLHGWRFCSYKSVFGIHCTVINLTNNINNIVLIKYSKISSHCHHLFKLILALWRGLAINKSILSKKNTEEIEFGTCKWYCDK